MGNIYVFFYKSGINGVGMSGLAILFIVLFIGTFVSAFVFFIIRAVKIQKNAKEIRERFDAYLANTDFKTTKRYADVLFDIEKRQWCVIGIRHIFDVEETVKATVHKKQASQTEKGRTTDTSKYEVYIETKNIDIPIVKSVGLTQETAEKIKATINIICDKK